MRVRGLLLRLGCSAGCSVDPNVRPKLAICHGVPPNHVCLRQDCSGTVVIRVAMPVGDALWVMLHGRLIAESCKPGLDIQVPSLRLVRLGRHDVTETTLPADERDAAPTPGVVAGQPRIWTFVDVEGPNDIADELAQAFANTLQPELGWWADFTIDDFERVIAFAGRVFRFKVGDEVASAEAKAWGRAHGTPEAQLDWR